MNKNNTIKKTVFLSVISATLLLSGCSTYKRPAVNDPSAETLVNQKMIELSSSIQNSLNALVKIERGDAPLKNLANPIGTTIAGRPESKPLAPIRVDSKYADGQSKASVSVVEQRLDTKVNIVWNNDAAKLIQNLSNQIGFSFEESGVKVPLKVSVNARNDSVKNILGVVAGQVEGRADIKVNLPSKTIKLIYR